jgi:hypothetical protein
MAGTALAISGDAAAGGGEAGVFSGSPVLSKLANRLVELLVSCNHVPDLEVNLLK